MANKILNKEEGQSLTASKILQFCDLCGLGNFDTATDTGEAPSYEVDGNEDDLSLWKLNMMILALVLLIGVYFGWQVRRCCSRPGKEVKFSVRSIGTQTYRPNAPDKVFFTDGGRKYHLFTDCHGLRGKKVSLEHRELCKHCQAKMMSTVG